MGKRRKAFGPQRHAVPLGFPEYSAYPIMGPGQNNRMRYFSLTCFEE